MPWWRSRRCRIRRPICQGMAVAIPLQARGRGGRSGAPVRKLTVGNFGAATAMVSTVKCSEVSAAGACIAIDPHAPQLGQLVVALPAESCCCELPSQGKAMTACAVEDATSFSAAGAGLELIDVAAACIGIDVQVSIALPAKPCIGSTSSNSHERTIRTRRSMLPSIRRTKISGPGLRSRFAPRWVHGQLRPGPGSRRNEVRRPGEIVSAEPDIDAQP